MDSKTKEQILRGLRADFGEAMRKAMRSQGFGNPFIENAFRGAEAGTSFFRSISTRLGQTIVPEMARLIANETLGQVRKDVRVEYALSSAQDKTLWTLLKALRQNMRAPDYQEELEEIRSSGRPNQDEDLQTGQVGFDLHVKAEKTGGNEYYVDIASPKTGQKSVEKYRRNALILGAEKPQAGYVLGIYYAVDEHRRHRRAGMNYVERYFRLDDEQPSAKQATALVGAAFWNWLGGSDATYRELLEIFQEVGKEYQEEFKTLFSGPIGTLDTDPEDTK